MSTGGLGDRVFQYLRGADPRPLAVYARETYPWSSIVDMTVPHVPLEVRFESPNGFTRVAVEEDSFGAFLRRLPVRMDRIYVLSHRGTHLGRPSAAVVVILDVAVDEQGRKAALIGQSFMPAQEFHVLVGRSERVLDGVWFLLPDTEHGELDTPSSRPFQTEHARRFK